MGTGLQTAHSSVIGDALKAGFQNFVDQSAVLTAVNGTPGAGQFRSSITGRAPIPDITNDLRVSGGIERVAVQSVVQLQNEFGPNGEPVFAAVNDDRGLIRLCGIWIGAPAVNLAYGQYLGGNNGDYAEITFYGTGLSLLSIVFLAQDIRVTVDGGAEGANIWPSSPSNILGGRNYSPNAVVPLVSGLSLGLHTVRLRANNANGIYISGFEILNANASGLININTGISYIQGQKALKSAISSIHYGKDSTNTTTLFPNGKGGKVVRYLNANGTVGEAKTAIPASPSYLASADHTNEEVARPYHWREFGAGRADDFSTLAGTPSDRAFTLDDGTTTLVASNCNVGTGEKLYLANNNSYVTLTFVGTGLDVLFNNVDATAVFTVYVDGTSVGTTSPTSGSSSTSDKILKIVSGLSYGTHTVKILRNSASSDALKFKQFIVYQPKKPSIPANAAELCDYNVMADFTANTVAGSESIATGTLRKHNTRELIYIGNWLTAGPSGIYIGGFQVYSTATAGNQCRLTFFGTGIELRSNSNTTWTANTAVTISSNGGSFLAATTANFPALVSSVYGGFTFSTGTLSQAVSNTVGSGLRISGLPLGLYTINLAPQDSKTLMIEGVDIITPIHSYKSNLYADLQNTLPVGSQSLMDTRTTSATKEALPSKKAWAQAVGVATPVTNSSSSYVPMPDLSVTIKTNGGPIRITGDAVVITPATANIYLNYAIFVDGVQVSQNRIWYSHVAATTSMSPFWDLIVPVSPGVHKVDARWAAGGATFNMYVDGNNGRILTVQEL